MMHPKHHLIAVIVAAICLTFPLAAVAQPPDEGPTPPQTEETAGTTTEDSGEQTPVIEVNFSAGDIAWMMTSSALVLMMVAPGLALFYSGLVRKKNVLSVMMQCIFLMGVMSIVWMAWGYSLAFSPSIMNGFVGGFDHLFLSGVLPTEATPNGPISGPDQAIPTILFATFQMMFFIITPALICGAFAERMKFSSMVLYSILWGTFVYCPIAHWVWADDGWLCEWNDDALYPALDFAGGTVVHISSGISALICCLMLGRRLGFGQEPMPPHNLTYTFIGATLLWVGWFGFNAGSAGGASMGACNAFLSTHLAASAGVIAWAGAEWVLRGKPSILGACSGAVAGLVCITPASGSATAIGGIFIGFAGGLASFFACTELKSRFKYDDSLDVFGVHGVSGIVGALLTGVFASTSICDRAGVLENNPAQMVPQVVSILAAAALAVVGSVILLKLIDLTIGLRVVQEVEVQGLDLGEHGEEGYIFL